MPDGLLLAGRDRKLRFPNDTHRHAIVGMTGSGKTVFGMSMLSRRSFNRRPWLIFDSKRDKLIRQIPHLNEIGIEERIPSKRGLYVVRPVPGQHEEIDQWLWKLWRHENAGLFIDEGYSIRAHSEALQAVLTQGRSKNLPVIALSQRPAHVSPFIMSESDFISVFYLQNPRDVERVQEYLPHDKWSNPIDPSELPNHHSFWWHGARREFARFGPCEPEDIILDRFDARKVRRYYI
jgi:DNA helicase HerA-like ATPase